MATVSNVIVGRSGEGLAVQEVCCSGWYFFFVFFFLFFLAIVVQIT